MYTPSPATRRPRPPGSLSRTREKSSPAALATTNTNAATPEIEQVRKRQISARSVLARISASPGDIQDVTMQLDENDGIGNQPKSRIVRIGLGLPGTLSLPIPRTAREVEAPQPSPPPPYGNDSVHPPQPATTPPGQDSEIPHHSAHSPGPSVQSTKSTGEVEERLRVRRATDAARAMGLDMDFGSGEDAESVGSEGSLSDGAVRHRLREVKRQLRRRDNGEIAEARVDRVRAHYGRITHGSESRRTSITHT
jgi:hypothetical protein